MLRDFLRESNVSKLDILTFTKNLQVILKSGLTVSDGLYLLSQNRSRTRWLVQKFLYSVENGEKLHTIMERYPKFFSPLYLSVVKVGEKTGTLEENFKRLVVDLEQRLEFRKKVLSALMYPAFVMTILLVVSFFVGTVVLPKLLPIFTVLNYEAPFATRVIIGFSRFFSENYVGVGIGMAFLIFGVPILSQLSVFRPFRDWLLLKLPIFKPVIVSMNLEMFTASMHLLFKSGVTYFEALNIIADTTNNVMYKRVYRQLAESVDAGQKISSNIKQHDKLFPTMVVGMLEMAERTGNLEDMFAYLNDFYKRQVEDLLKNLSTMIEPIMIVIVAVIVTMFVYSILVPIYESLNFTVGV